ncbi:MAG: SpoIID/LytB domain-containing protein, partial [Chloroflexota bacterium]|nr:SpoIID/LytB domain-containing protein [Chloroflexota bacterium]
ETGHRLCWGFRTYWRGHGLDFGEPGFSYRESLALFGYPISEEFRMVGEDGREYTMQYFERARFEWHPQNQPPYDILLGRLGADLLAAPVTVRDVRVGQGTDYTRIVVETDRPATYQRATSAGPDRIVLDVERAVLGSNAGELEVDDGTVREIRWAQFTTNPDVVRVIIELEVATAHTVSTLDGPSRLVVDVTKQRSTSPAPPIRVGLLWQQQSVAFSGTGPFAVINLATGGTVATAAANSTWQVRAAPEGYAVITPQGAQVGVYNGPMRVRLQDPGSARLVAKNTQYRGEFEVRKNAAGQIALVNELDSESYLQGVVPREMPASWHPQALRTQAVAARTYARANLGKRGADGCDLYDTTADQVYGGASSEQAGATAAVNDTRGTTAVCDGRRINAFFFSSAGGHTEHNDAVFGGTPVPYLRGVPVPAGWEAASPHSAWTATIPHAELEAKLNANPATAVGALTDLTFREQGASGRWLWAEIRGATGTKTVRAGTFRLVVGALLIKSTLFTMTKSGDDFVFRGAGYGHGVGLSQYGAQGAAAAGYGFRKILRAFYTDGTRFMVEY